MSDGKQMSFQQRSLVQQGYADYSRQQLTEMEWGLRFTPFVCALIALYGLATGQPWILFSVAALGIWAFLLPASHPMDMLYNHLVRPVLGAARIPPNPMQRRLACLSAAMMNILAGSLLLLGMPLAAYVVGGCLLVLQAIVIATHFCALSWIYEGVARMVGKWNRPLQPQEAVRHLRGGATVIDVRSPQEFADQHLACALNMPLESLSGNLSQLPSGTLLVHCKSGMRSNMALQLLRKNGFTQAYNLGGFERAKGIVEAV